MAKDKRARAANHLTVVALANITAVLVDTMRVAGAPNHVVHYFIDELERINDFTLYGPAGDLMDYLTSTLRGSVPGND